MNSGTAADARRGLDSAMLRGVGLIALFAVIAAVARVAQDVAIAWRFGTGGVVDAYYFIVSLINWPVGVALSVLTLLAAPADASAGPKATSTTHFQSELLGAVLLVAAASVPIAWWILHIIAGSSIGGLEPATRAEAIAGIPGLVAAVPLGLVGALLSAWFVSRKRHGLALLEGLPPTIVTAIVVLVPGAVLFWGTSTGAAMQVLAMMVVLRVSGELPRPRLGFSAVAWRSFALGAVALLTGQALFLLVPAVDAFFAARLGEGMLAAMGYANRLIVGLTGLAGLALQRAGLPLLADLATVNPGAARRAALRWAAAAAGAGAGMALIVWFAADLLVSLLFERGSFTTDDRERVASLLRIGIWQAPALLGGMALATALASLRSTVTLMLAAAAGLSVKVALSFVLTDLNGAAGLQLATVTMYAATALLCWVALRKTHPASTALKSSSEI